MEAKIPKETDAREILIKLARLQADVEYIKSHIKSAELKIEIAGWEETSVEDTSNFLKKNNL